MQSESVFDSVERQPCGDESEPHGTMGARRPGVRRRRLVIALASIFVGLLALAVYQGVESSSSSQRTALVGPSGAAAPLFSVITIGRSQQSLSLQSLRGRDVVLNFWASWCLPCRREMPLLEAASRATRGRVKFVGVDSNDTERAAMRFLTQVHVTYPAVFDGSGSVANAYGLFGLPTTVFVSPRGIIVGRHIGELNANALRAALTEAFHVS